MQCGLINYIEELNVRIYLQQALMREDGHMCRRDMIFARSFYKNDATHPCHSIKLIFYISTLVSKETGHESNGLNSKPSGMIQVCQVTRWVCFIAHFYHDIKDHNTCVLKKQIRREMRSESHKYFKATKILT